MAGMKPPSVRRVFTALSKMYEPPKWRRSRPAIDSLILTILSQNTNDRNSTEGFRRLKAAFRDWGAVEKAHWRKVASAIKVSGLANIKSRRIRKILGLIRESHGSYSLEFLDDMNTHAAHKFLLDIPGVGPKTAACVLMFSFGKPVFPVDTHILRVSKRLGLIGTRVNAAEAHEKLQATVPKAFVYPLHLMMIRHGRDTCHARKPECEKCILQALCALGRSSRSRRSQQHTTRLVSRKR